MLAPVRRKNGRKNLHLILRLNLSMKTNDA